MNPDQNYLTKDNLIELDNEIDSIIIQNSVLTLGRDNVVYNLLVAFEDAIRILTIKLPELASIAELSRQGFASIIKHQIDAIHFALVWAYKYCPEIDDSFVLKVSPSIYTQAGDLLLQAGEYSNFWDLMVLLWDGLKDGKTKGIRKENTIEVVSNSEDNSVLDVADRILSSPDDPEIYLQNMVGRLDFTFINDIEVKSKSSPIDPNGESKISYFVPKAAFKKVFDGYYRESKSSWNFDENWSVSGRYSFKDLRLFWVTLKAFSWIHYWVCLTSGTQGMANGSVVRVMPMRRWINLIYEYTSLPKNVISNIIEDLIFDKDLQSDSVKGRKKPDAVYQPFYPLANNLLALSSWVVLQSNAERNMWDLISIKYPETHSKLRNLKEAIWVTDLKKRLVGLSYNVFDRIDFSFGGKSSDLDLLVIDKKMSYGLAVQLKWLTSPDRIKEVIYVSNEIDKGVAQAELSLKAINNKSINIPDEYKSFKFDAIVLSYNFTGGNFVKNKNVPVINERLFQYILERHGKSLNELYAVSKFKSFLPREGYHYDFYDIKSDFGHLKFLGKRMGLIFKEPWDPDVDIKYGQQSSPST